MNSRSCWGATFRSRLESFFCWLGKNSSLQAPGDAIYSSSTRMRRAILLLMLGIFCTALCSSAITVYIFHDVDKDPIGHWNEAFAGLCTESVLFTTVVGGGVALLTLLGRHLFRLKGYPPRAKVALFLGIGVTVVQYPWDFIGRAEFPKFSDRSLTVYPIVAIVLCSVVIVRDNLRQMRLCHVRLFQASNRQASSCSWLDGPCARRLGWLCAS